MTVTDQAPGGRVRITGGGLGTIYVRAERLGSRFDLYRTICKMAGLSWDKRGANYGPLERLDPLLSAFEAARFAVDLGPDIVAMMGQKIRDAEAAGEKARARMRLIEALTGIRYRDYQVADIEWMERAGCGVNANQMRLGKTPEMLALVEERLVVVCPGVAVDVWLDHVRWLCPWLSTRVVKHRREWSWPERWEAVIGHYETMPPRMVEGGGGPYMDRDHLPLCPKDLLVVFDEAQALKNESTIRHKRADSLATAARLKGGRVWPITGTPGPNGKSGEVWAFLKVAGVATSLWKDRSEFKRDYTFGDAGEVTGKLSQVMVRRLRSQVIGELPPRDDQIRRMDLPAKGEEREFLDALWTRILELGLDQNPDELLRRLRFDPDFASYSEIRALLAKAKIPTVLATVEEYEEEAEPLVVMSVHRAPIDALRGRPGWAVFTGEDSRESRLAAVADFRSGRKKYIAYTCQTGGTAVDLSVCGAQRAEAMLVVDRGWVPGDNAQGEDRIVNLSEPISLTYIYPRWRHPLEEHVEDILDAKTREISRVIDRVAERCGDPDRTLAQMRTTYERARSRWGEDPRGVFDGSSAAEELKAAGLADLFGNA